MADDRKNPDAENAPERDVFFEDGATVEKKPQDGDDTFLTSPIDAEADKDVTLANLHMGGAQEGENFSGDAVDAPLQHASLQESDPIASAQGGDKDTTAFLSDEEPDSSLSIAQQSEEAAAQTGGGGSSIRSFLQDGLVDDLEQVDGPVSTPGAPASSSGTALAGLTPLNVADAPVAGVDEVYEGLEDEVINGNLLENEASGADLGLILEAGQYETEQGGLIIVDDNGSFTYVPPENFAGEDRFPYEFFDSNGNTGSAEAVFSVSPVADEALVAAEDVTGDEGTRIALDISAGLSDTDGSETISLSLNGLPAGTVLSDGVSETVVPANGVVDITDWDLNSLSLDVPKGLLGNFAVTVNAVTQDGDDVATVAQDFNLFIANVNDAPVAEFSTVEAMEDGGTVTGQLSASDFDGDALTYSLVSGPDEGFVTVNPDGSYSFNPGSEFQDLDDGESRGVSFTYEVDDGNGGIDQATVTVTVSGTNDGPVVGDVDLGATDEDTALVITQAQLLANSSDVDGDSLSIAAVTLDDPSVGDLSDNGDGSWTFTPADDFNGDDIGLSFDVSDGTETIAGAATFDVTAVNDGPVAQGGTENAVEDGAAVEGQLSASDVDGDTLTYSLVSGPDEGSVTVNPDGSYSFDPGSDFQDLGDGDSRDVSFIYEVDDGNGGTDQATVTVTVSGTNDGPVVGAVDLGATDEDTALVITEAQLLANSSDVDGDSLSIAAVTLDDPSVGSLSDNGDGSWTFTPADDFNGDDIGLSFDVSDGTTTTSGQASFDVLAVNDGPEADSGTIDAVEDGAAVNGQLSASDIDGDDLSYSLVTGPDEGSVTVNPDGSYSFDPGSDFQDLGVGESRDVSFTYEVDDNNGGTDQATVTITVSGTNDGPVVGDIDLGATEEDAALVITEAQLLANASDADGDALSVGAIALDDPSAGSLSDNGDGSWTFTPAEHFSADDISLSFEVSDGNATTTAHAALDITAIADEASLAVGSDPVEIDPSQTITGTSRSETLEGGSGSDTISGGSGHDVIYGDGNSDPLTTSLDIQAQFPDMDGSETHSILVSGLPDGGSLSAGQDQGDGSWVLSVEDLDGLTLTVPSGSSDFTLDVQAQALEQSNGDSAVTSASIDVSVTAEGNDIIIGGRGNDALFGQAGDDRFEVGGTRDGYDRFDGGEGRDEIAATADGTLIGIDRDFDASNSIETITADGHDNVAIRGDSGSQTLDFSNTDLVGIDYIDGGSGHDRITGTDAGDVIIGNRGNDVLDGGQGDDRFEVSGTRHGFDRFQGGAGQDEVVATSDGTLIGIDRDFNASNSIETITADGHDNVAIRGDGGSQTLDFSNTDLVGIDYIDGGSGHDRITGTDADDVIIGNRGNDTLDGGQGDDRFEVEGTRHGFDRFQGGAGQDEVVATSDGTRIGIDADFGAGNSIESISAGGHSGVTISGDNGSQVLDFSNTALDGIESIDGGGGHDQITGTDQADNLFGGSGNDRLTGGQGDDFIDGESGNDLAVFTGNRDEYFVTLNADGSYTVEDLTPGRDGTDRIINVQEFEFADGVIDEDDLIATNPNSAPETSTVDLGATAEDTAIVITEAELLANASDVDGDSLSVAALTLDDPSTGTLTDNGDGSWTFTPTDDFHGDDIALSYEISDGLESVNGQAHIDVTPVNDGPVVGAVDLGATDEDTALVITQAQLLANSSDVDGDSLSVATVTLDDPSVGSLSDNGDGSWTFTPTDDFHGDDIGLSFDVSDGTTTTSGQASLDVNAINDAPIAGNTHTSIFEDTASRTGQLFGSDADGDNLSFSLVSGPSEGAVTVNPDGSYSFETNGDFEDLGVGETREVSFNYEVDDGQGGTSQGQVRITVYGENDGPVVGDVDLGATDEDTALVITQAQLLANSSDVDGDSLSIAAVSLDDPSVGSLSDNGDGSWTFTPADDFNGDDIGLSFDVSDGTTTTSGQASLDVNAINDAPIAGNTHSGIYEDMPSTSGQLFGSDVDGDDLSFSLVSGPSEGSVTINPDGSYSFETNGDFEDLDVGESRDVSFSYEVDDGNGGAAQGQVTITVYGTNDGPVVGAVDLGATDEDTALVITEAQLLANSSDVDGDSLSIAAVTLDDPSVGSLSDNGDGSWTFTPADDFNGDDIGLSFDVSDGTTTTSGQASFDVLAVNDGPEADSGTIDAVEDGAAVNGQLSASDIDGDDLSYSLVTGPDEGSVTVNPDGSYSFDPGSDFQDLGVGESRDVSFTYEVDDNNGGTDQATVTVTVTGTNDDPVIQVSGDGDRITSNLQDTTLSGDRMSGQLDANTTISGTNANGDASQLVQSSSGIGVQGGFINSQIDFVSSTGQSETLELNFDEAVDNLTLTTSRQFESEFPGGEQGQWTAYDADGNVIGTGILSPDTAETRINNNSFTYELDTGGAPISSVVIEAIDVTGQSSGNNSDFSVHSIAYDIADVPLGDDALEAFVDENAAGGAFIADVDATDIDGDTLSYAIISGNDDGSFTIDPTSGEVTLNDGHSLDFESDTSRTLVVEVADGQGGTDTAEILVTINDINEGPIAASAAFSTGEDASAFTGQLSGSDPDGDTLTYSLVSGPASGSVSVNADGSFSFDPGSDFQDLGDGESRDVTFTYEVDDGRGGTDQATVTMTIDGSNDGPTVSNIDLGAIAEDSSIVITEAQLLANASDVEGDDLSITALGLDDPSVGTLADNGDGSWTFTPADDLSADDISLSFDVSDGTVTHSATAQVDVTAVADAPTLNVTADVTTLGVDFEDDTDFDEGGSQDWSLVDADSLDGWQTDNAGNVIEVGRETVYGGSDPDNVVIELEANDGDASNLYTDVNTQDGGVYTLAFDFSARRGAGGADSEIEVYWDGELIDTITPGNDFGFTSYSYNLEGDGDPSRLEFRASDASGQNSVGGLIDNISLVQTGFAEQTTIALNIDVGLTDTDGSEDLSVDITNLPAGALLSDGTHSVTISDTSESVDISDWDLASTTITPGESFSGTINAQVTATSTESTNGDSQSVTQNLSFDIVETTAEPSPLDVNPDDYDNQISGTSGNDNWLFATNEDDYVDTGNGNDRAYGLGGDDFMDGGDGNDRLYGGSGDDVLVGGDGNDRLYGNSGNDTFFGGAGNDRLEGGDGDDLFIFGQNDGTDTVEGGNGNWVDTIDVSGENGDLADGAWTVTLENGDTHTLSQGETLDLGENVSGTLEFDDGTMISFEGIERITW